MHSKPFILGTKIHSGLNLPFYKALDYLIDDDIHAAEISVAFPSDGDDPWERIYHYPETGLGYSHWSLGNDEILGRAHAVYGFINIPVFGKRSFAFYWQVSAGGAFITKKFSIGENYLNRAIGSHANVFIRFAIDGEIKLTNRSNIIFGTGITHFSNGKTRSPNYGINAGSVSFGMNYRFGNEEIITSETELPAIGKKLINTIIVSAGTKVYDNLDGRTYVAGSISYNLERRINQYARAGLGSNLSFDGSIREGLVAEKYEQEISSPDLFRLGVHVSYACRYKNLIAGLQIGHYLYSRYRVLTNIYNRVSVQYVFNSKIIGSISIKSHWGKADCLEYGIGYTW